MGKEEVSLKDRLTLKLYDKNGKLIKVSRKKEEKTDKILKFLLKLLEAEKG